MTEAEIQNFAEYLGFKLRNPRINTPEQHQGGTRQLLTDIAFS